MLLKKKMATLVDFGVLHVWSCYFVQKRKNANGPRDIPPTSFSSENPDEVTVVSHPTQDQMFCQDWTVPLGHDLAWFADRLVVARTITLCRGDLWRVLGRARSVPLGHDLARFADRHAGAHIDHFWTEQPQRLRSRTDHTTWTPQHHRGFLRPRRNNRAPSAQLGPRRVVYRIQPCVSQNQSLWPPSPFPETQPTFTKRTKQR